MKDRIRVGAGSGWWGDRVEPAAPRAEKGDLDYLCFETMAEATVSAAQVRARRDPTFPGYDTYLDDRMQAVLPGCLRRGTKIVTNQGWLNPDGAAKRIAYWLAQHGAKGKKVAAVPGGIITDRVLQLTDRILENGKPTPASPTRWCARRSTSAPSRSSQALTQGADVVVTAASPIPRSSSRR
jgi:hypothetical protein